MRSVYLETVLTRIASARHYDCLAADGHFLSCIECQLGHFQPKHLLGDGFGHRSLHRQLTVAVALIGEGEVEALGVTGHPVEVFVDVRGIDDEEEAVVGKLVDQQVVNGAAVVVAHHAVEHFAHGCSADVAGEDVAHVAFGIGAADGHFSHVAYVEHTALAAHGMVLGGNV